MDGSSWVAFVGVLSTLAGVIFTQVYQGRRERQRQADATKARAEDWKREADQQKTQRWLELRRELYARFLRGADALQERHEERVNWLLYGGDPSPDPSDAHLTEIEDLTLISACTAALEEMRLFSPTPVVKAASEYVGLAIEVERSGVLAALTKREAHEEGAGDSAVTDAVDGLVSIVEHRSDVARGLLSAMRADLDVEPSLDAPGLGGVVRFPAWG
jgi:hypothetical protein